MKEARRPTTTPSASTTIQPLMICEALAEHVDWVRIEVFLTKRRRAFIAARNRRQEMGFFLVFSNACACGNLLPPGCPGRYERRRPQQGRASLVREAERQRRSRDHGLDAKRGLQQGKGADSQGRMARRSPAPG